MEKNRRIYPKICENPECLKDFLATGKSARFCSRECRGVYSKDVLSKLESKDYLPVTNEGYFDADAFCSYFYPSDKVYLQFKTNVKEYSIRNIFNND